MAVYVDDMHLSDLGKFGRMRMCHMIADSSEELLAMAARIGVAARWIQKPGTPREHFDIASGKRALAVKCGAVEITMRQAAAMTSHRAAKGSLGDPETAAAWRSQLAAGKPPSDEVRTA